MEENRERLSGQWLVVFYMKPFEAVDWALASEFLKDSSPKRQANCKSPGRFAAYAHALEDQARSQKSPEQEKTPYVLPHEEDLEQLISVAGKSLSIPTSSNGNSRQKRRSSAAEMGTCVPAKKASVNNSREGRKLENAAHRRATGRSAQRIKRETELVFNVTFSSISSNYYQQRLKIARKTGNPRLRTVGLHDFRQRKLTQVAKEFNGNAHYVQYFAGHKDLNTQQIYVHLAEQYYGTSASSEFVVEVAKTLEEAERLLAVGFEFVHEHQGVTIYRRRK